MKSEVGMMQMRWREYQQKRKGPKMGCACPPEGHCGERLSEGCR